MEHELMNQDLSPVFSSTSGTRKNASPDAEQLKDYF
jgi:hypothetical protein